MSVKPDLQADLNALRQLPFKRYDKLNVVMSGLHDMLDAERPVLGAALTEVLRGWLLTPFTLWPVDFQGIAEWVVECHRKRRSVSPDVEFVLSQVDELPDLKVCEAVVQYERLVEKGDYDQLVKSQEKFAERQAQLMNSDEFQQNWSWLKENYRQEFNRSGKAVHRRSLVQERNFRPDFEFSGTQRKRRFQAAFDAFCYRWNLYGMEGDRPLLLKVSVNLTAHGTMIVIPAYWSFDRRRDLKWEAIMELHKLRNESRQGPKLSSNRMEKSALAKVAKTVASAARKRGLRGEAVFEAIRKGVGQLADKDSREIRRLLGGR